VGREYRHEERSVDVLVVGGGMSGVAAAVVAARCGARVAMVQDRPVLGGNASTEIRVNIEGANGGVHNRFFVESGLAEDLLLENFWRNPTGSADHWGALLLDLMLSTRGIDLHLDTHAYAVKCNDARAIVAVQAMTLSSEHAWTFHPKYVVDATGDATIAYLAGAEFMRGEEGRDEFGEPLAPVEATDYKLGGTMQFMCKDMGRPVRFEAPAFARKVTAAELRINRPVNVWGQAPVLGGFWWIEYGGHLDTIDDNPDIKLTLLSELYGVWDYVKNSPEWRDKNANLDLEWVAALPGKRESRRVVGDYVLTENDMMQGTRFRDAVSFGGWSLDKHAPLGFMDFERTPCTQVQPPGVYQIPLRSLYARDVSNLYLAGRCMSASHIACCSSRVMLTCTTCGEAVGVAAALSAERDLTPQEMARNEGALRELRLRLGRAGHYIPFVELEADRVPPDARASSSSAATLEQADITETVELAKPRMVSLPLVEGRLDTVNVWLETDAATEIRWRLFGPESRGLWLPGALLAEGSVDIDPLTDGGWAELPIAVETEPGFVHLALASDDPRARIGVSRARPLGPLSWLCQVTDIYAMPVDRRLEDRWDLPQHVEATWGDSFAFPFSYWRRDSHGWGGSPGWSIAFRASPQQSPATADKVLEPFERPTVTGVHCWASSLQSGRRSDGKFVFDEPQWLLVELPAPVEAEAVELLFNSDLDRHLANIWYSHPAGERAMSTLVADFTIETRGTDGTWEVIADVRDNHQRRALVQLCQPVEALRLTCLATHGERYASVMDVRLRSNGAA
jgi:hypothetical protein